MILLAIGIVMVVACSYVSYSMGYAYGNNKGKDQILKENIIRFDFEQKRMEMMYQRQLRVRQNCIAVSEVKDGNNMIE